MLVFKRVKWSKTYKKLLTLLVALVPIQVLLFELVQNNLSEINRYGFQDGVSGLARMASQAAGLRINMSETFEFAGKVFNPEGAINMVATFQRLGVAAGDLADPFRLMYLASEDTEELQNQIVKND
jgi:hypothetical protein